MTAFAICAMILAATGLVVVVAQLWTIGTTEQTPVGPWRSPEPVPPHPPRLPNDYLSLWSAERAHWSRSEHEWSRLVDRLNEFEQAFGGTTPPPRAPDRYSEAWLAHRLAQVEALAGPLPATRDPNPHLSHTPASGTGMNK